MKNNYYISGMPRSGSTLLFNILKQNPNLFSLTKGRYWGTDKSLPDLFIKYKPKILVTYRPILEVLASFIKLAEQYPQVNFIDKLMLEQEFPTLYYRPINDARCDWLMRPSGAIESNNSVFKNMVVHAEWFHLVTYEDLVTNPKETIAKIYDFLEIEHYALQHGGREQLSLKLKKTLPFVQMTLQRGSFSSLERLWKDIKEKLGE